MKNSQRAGLWLLAGALLAGTEFGYAQLRQGAPLAPATDCVIPLACGGATGGVCFREPCGARVSWDPDNRSARRNFEFLEKGRAGGARDVGR
jgi:hypothetical protein